MVKNFFNGTQIFFLMGAKVWSKKKRKEKGGWRYLSNIV